MKKKYITAKTEIVEMNIHCLLNDTSDGFTLDIPKKPGYGDPFDGAAARKTYFDFDDEEDL